MASPSCSSHFGLGGNLIFPWYVGASSVLYAGSPRTAANVFAAVAHYQPTIVYNAPTGYAAALALESFGTYRSLLAAAMRLG